MAKAIMLTGSESDDVREAARDAKMALTEALGGLELVGTMAQLMQFCALVSTANGGNSVSLVELLSGRLQVSEHPDPYFRPATQVFTFGYVALRGE